MWGISGEVFSLLLVVRLDPRTVHLLGAASAEDGEPVALELC